MMDDSYNNSQSGQQVYYVQGNMMNNVFSQLNELSNQFIDYQNENDKRIQEINLKLNYINDSLNELKQVLNDINRQKSSIKQNQSTNCQSRSISPTKIYEVFNKHLISLSKDIEALNYHQPPPLQQQIAPQTRSNMQSPRNERNLLPDNTSYQDINLQNEINRPFSKALSLRSQEVQPNSDSSSPFLSSSRLNFDLPLERNTSNRNIPFVNESQSITFTLSNNIPSNQTQRNNFNDDNSNSKGKKRKKSGSNKSDDQRETPPNSYSLPLPPNLGEEPSTGQRKSKAQFINVVPREISSGTILTSAMSGQISQTRQNFFGDDDQGIDELDNSSVASEEYDDSPKSKNNENVSKVPQYKLEKSLKTIADIWKEYEYGANDKPPLRTLESKYGTKWRNETESRTFLRRKRIYEAIETGKAKGYRENQIIQDLEDHRSYKHNGSIRKKPLSWLCSNFPAKYND